MKFVLKISMSLLVLMSGCLGATSVPDAKSVVIAWDLHGVVIKRDRAQIARRILTDKRCLYVLANMSWGLFKALLELRKQHCSAEKYIATARFFGNEPLAELIKEVSYDQPLIEGTYAIILALRQLGITQVIASNIQTDQFIAFQKQNPVVFAPSSTPLFVLDRSQMAYHTPDANGADFVVEKPQQRFFDELKAKNTDTRIIFIDDSITNVKAAQLAGIESLLFTTPEKLLHDLKAKSINVAIAQ